MSYRNSAWTGRAPRTMQQAFAILALDLIGLACIVAIVRLMAA